MLLVLPFAAAVLISLYSDAVEHSFDARLHQNIEYLIATTSRGKSVEILEPPIQGEPMFSLPFSGWYYQIKSLSDQRIIYRSDSLVSETLKLPSERGISPGAEGSRRAYITGPEEQPLRILEREISITEKDQQRRYAYAVAGDANEIYIPVDAFRWMLIVAFCMLGAGLLIATFFQVQWGLRPLHEIGAKLAAIRSGEASQLEGALPEEIQPLQEELNALIQSNQQIIERARTHVGNLAHALKTPLSVITNEARGQSGDFPAKVAEQAELMREHITHHLSRAQIAARVSIVGGVTDVGETLRSLTNALSRIFREKDITFSVDCPAGAKFRGEKQDLQEMVGNLLDNACKWTASKVEVRVELMPGTRPGAGRQLAVMVIDDGPGLPPDKLNAAVQRGNRLDESKPGTGLGLSIVADLADIYYGNFTLQNVPEGGLCAKVSLPAA